MTDHDLSKFSGVMPALFTPFDQGGNLDTDRLLPVLDWLLQRGVSGFYVAGSTGEWPHLTMDERKSLVQAVCDHAGSRTTVIAHVGCNRTDDAVVLAAHAESAGADAVSAIAPAYYGMNTSSLKRYYGRIAQASDLPVIIYTMPIARGSGMDVEQVQAVAETPNVLGVKYTGSDSFQMQLMSRLSSGRFIVFNGSDQELLSGLAAGACGGIGTSYNMMPNLFARLYERFRANDIQAAQVCQDRINRVIRLLFEFDDTVHSAARTVLKRMGLGLGNPREPILTLSEEIQHKLIARFEELGFFEWIEE